LDRLKKDVVVADERQLIEQQPHLAGDEGAERESFLAAVRGDLENLREEVRRQEKPRERLVEAAPLIYEALKGGVKKEAILRVLARRGYTGTRAMFLYFLKKHLERELIKQGITPDGWRTKPLDTDNGGQQTALKRAPEKMQVLRRERRRETIQKLATDRAAVGGTIKVFKEDSAKEETEFDRRLGEAIRQRKKSGDWEKL
jgi:hypothetical protein